jgi:hypothetical protein
MASAGISYNPVYHPAMPASNTPVAIIPFRVVVIIRNNLSARFYLDTGHHTEIKV